MVDTFHDPSAKRTMIEIAVHYERMARYAALAAEQNAKEDDGSEGR